MPVLDEKTLKAALGIQRQEITEYHIYLYLAKICKDQHNAEVLLSVSKAEKDHAAFWMEKTGVSVKPSGFKIGWLNDTRWWSLPAPWRVLLWGGLGVKGRVGRLI